MTTASSAARPPDECEAILSDIADRALIVHSTRAGRTYYNLQPYIAGYWETTELSTFYNNGEDLMACKEVLSLNGCGIDYPFGLFANTFGLCTANPIGPEVVAEDELMPFMDWRQRVRNAKFWSLAACQCEIRNKALDDVE